MVEMAMGRIGSVRMEPVWEEVEELGILVPRALNPEELPLTPASGRLVGLTEVQFEYRGPVKRLAVAWGLKPAGFVDFNNGDSLIPQAWNWGVVVVDEAAEWAPFSTVSPAGLARATMPYAGDYTTRGGYAARLHVGTADTWVWLADYDLAEQIAEEILVAIDDLLVQEELILVIDTDADVVELQAPPPPAADVRALEVRYEFV